MERMAAQKRQVATALESRLVSMNAVGGSYMPLLSEVRYSQSGKDDGLVAITLGNPRNRGEQLSSYWTYDEAFPVGCLSRTMPYGQKGQKLTRTCPPRDGIGGRLPQNK